MMKYSKKRIQKMVVDKIRSTEQPLTLVQLSKEIKVQRVNLQPVVRAMVEDGTLEMVKPGGDLAPTFSLPEASSLHPEDAKAVSQGQDHGSSDLALTQLLSREGAVTHTANATPHSGLETAPINVEGLVPQIDYAPAQRATSDSSEKIVTDEHNDVVKISDPKEVWSHPVFRTWFSKTKAVRSYPLIGVGDISSIINGRYQGENYLPTFVAVGEIGFWIAVNQDIMSSGWFPYFIPGALLLIDANKRHVHKGGVHLVCYKSDSRYAIKRLDMSQTANTHESGMTVIGRVVDVRLKDLI